MTAQGRQKAGLTAIARIVFDKEVRDVPPETRYATIAKFEGHPPQFTLQAEFIDWKDDGWEVMALVDFLVDSAPHELLVRGAEFDLLEGPHKTATGKVLVASQRIPPSHIVDTKLKDEPPRRAKDTDL